MRIYPRSREWHRLIPTVAALWLVLSAGGPLIAADPLPPASPAFVASTTAAITEEVAAHAGSADELYGYIKDWDNKRVGAAKLEELGDQAKPFVLAFLRDKVVHLQPAVDTFLARYPDDPRRWDVKLGRLWWLATEEHIPKQEYTDTYRQIVAAPEASRHAKRRARYMLLLDLLSHPDITPEDFSRDDQEITAFEKDFPEDDNGAEFVTTRLEQLNAIAPDRIVPTLEKLTASPNGATARAARDQLSLRTQPIDLRFTSLDGTLVDLAKLRGKVVLIDFWATWCGPCMAKLPEVLALNRKYAGKDFQLLGVSLDEDADAARKIIASKAMAWPQDCDGKGWRSEIARRFNVHTIPNVWLIDKKGMAHPLDAEKDDLDARVATLLAEP